MQKNINKYFCRAALNFKKKKKKLKEIKDEKQLEKEKKNCTQHRDLNEIQKMGDQREGYRDRFPLRSTGRRIRHRRGKYEKEVKGCPVSSNLCHSHCLVESRVLDNNGSAGNERPHGYP